MKRVVHCRSSRGRSQFDTDEEHRGARGYNKVADWPYHRSQDIVEHRILKIARIYWRGLGPSQESKPCDCCYKWQQDRPDRINMFDRIERDSTKHARGWVAAQVCHPGMG